MRRKSRILQLTAIVFLVAVTDGAAAAFSLGKNRPHDRKNIQRENSSTLLFSSKNAVLGLGRRSHTHTLATGTRRNNPPRNEWHHNQYQRDIINPRTRIPSRPSIRSNWKLLVHGNGPDVSSVDPPSNGDTRNDTHLELYKDDLSQKKRLLTRDFLTIGIPTLIQLAAEPLAGLVDTAYLGRLGPEVLGGAGVAISAHYAVSKLYNDPLLRTSISLVAASDASTGTGSSSRNAGLSTSSSTTTTTNGTTTTTNSHSVSKQSTPEKSLTVAVSSALLLAAIVGLVQMIVYAVFCSAITQGMGLSPLTSPMWESARSYLHIRAYGTPAATLWLVTNGIFRGLGDTTTPLIYSLLFTALNAILDPIFIFVWHWGASGAAAGTALAQYIALVPLLMSLHRKVPFLNGFTISGSDKSEQRNEWKKELLASIQQYLSAGGLVMFRSVAKVLAYAVCARQAALLGSVAAAAYNLTFQLGFATTQICEAVAVAVQTLLAREMGANEMGSNGISKVVSSPVPAVPTLKQPDNVIVDLDASLSSSTTVTRVLSQQGEVVRHLIQTSLWLGGGVATTLAGLTFWRRSWIVSGLTTNTEIQAAVASIFPVVLLTQILKGLAYPVNGIIMGGLDWTSSMIAMWIANLVCLGMIRYFCATSASGIATLSQLWWSLAAFMGTQVVAGIVRFEGKRGVWKILRYQCR